MNSYSNYEEARRLMAQGQYEQAAALFEQNAKANPHFKELELWGECLMHLQRLSEAIVPLAAATTLNKGVRAPSLLAEVFYRRGEMQDAHHMAQLALSRDPNNRKALDIKKRTGAASRYVIAGCVET